MTAEKARDAFTALGRSLLQPAAQASTDYQAAVAKALSCPVRGENELCPLGVDLSGPEARSQQLSGELTASHGAYYVVKVPAGKMLKIDVGGPKGVAAMAQCQNGEVSGTPNSAISLKIEQASLCAVSVGIPVEKFEGFGPFKMTISVE